MYTLIEIFVSVGVLMTLLVAVSCVCGCKNSNQKSELVGTAGVVKLCLDEETPSPTPTTPASIKRLSTQNSQRSLPEIPHLTGVGRHDSGDTASEIYATVNLDGANKVAETPSTSREHPYEHAYAKLQNENHNVNIENSTAQTDNQIETRDATQNGPESVLISASVAISGQLPSSQELPYITPPSPRPNTDNAPHFSGDSTDSAKGYTSISVREPLSNIRAQLANKAESQPHYATVSDDSDEMYAAIEEASVGTGSDTYAKIVPKPQQRDSMREPLQDANLYNTRRSAPPEMGASTSKATHSRQASSSSICGVTSILGSPKPEKRQANSPLPPPPSAHQRISSTGDLQFNEKLRRSLNEKHQRNNSCVSSSDFYGCNYPVEKHRFSSGDIVRPLVAKEFNFNIDQQKNNKDDLYNSIEGTSYSGHPSIEINSKPNPEIRLSESPLQNVEDMYAKVMKKIKMKVDEDVRKPREFQMKKETLFTYKGDDPGYETIDKKKTSNSNHGYETIVHESKSNFNKQDPGYETVKEFNNSCTSKNHIKRKNSVDSGPSSILSSDPGYEYISKADNNYEVLRNELPTPSYATIEPNYKTQPTYSTVNKRPLDYDWSANNNTKVSEPNYETMPPEYFYNTGSESDPNYESVQPKDPNYESMSSQDPNYESLNCKDPKYESLKCKGHKYNSLKFKKEPNYESVKYFEISKKDPHYEKVGCAESAVDRTDSSGYEKVNVPKEKNTKGAISNGNDSIVSDYFQV